MRRRTIFKIVMAYVRTLGAGGRRAAVCRLGGSKDTITWICVVERYQDQNRTISEINESNNILLEEVNK